MLYMEPRILALYQEKIDRYSDSHPFLLVKLADLFILLSAGTLAIALYRKVRYWCLHLVIFKLTRLTATQAQNILSTRGTLKVVFQWMILLRTTILKLTNKSMQLRLTINRR